ncbi:TPA: PIG-L family deacetylase [bacterium]|nr:PIG-L family deacetylase [bacterium]
MNRKILYIYPHPDDESFGPAAVIHSQIKKGHSVYLLTLTKGGATQQRHRLGLTIDEMGEIRYKEMLEVEKVLGLSEMTVLDFPDSGLKEIDVRIIEQAIKNHIKKIMPDIVVSYPVHGISGFHDHLVTHAVVKRVYLELKDHGCNFLKRLAFWTLLDSGEPTWIANDMPRLKLTEEALIDCIVTLKDDDIQAMRDALNCYVTYRETIKKSGVIEKVGNKAYFEIFGEDFKPVLDDLTSYIA